MRVLRAADHKRMPWKNGGGETVEIAVFPEGAGLTDFDWRISMARVDGDGPFSQFPGIDRTLAILDGAGIILDVEGDGPRQLTIESAPHFFPADLPTSARLIDGTGFDFNVMSRRDKVANTVEHQKIARDSPEGPTRLVLCGRGTFEITINQETQQLGASDAVLVEPAETARLMPGPDSQFYLVEIHPV